jgi:hypothetical protein
VGTGEDLFDGDVLTGPADAGHRVQRRERVAAISSRDQLGPT